MLLKSHTKNLRRHFFYASIQNDVSHLLQLNLKPPPLSQKNFYHQFGVMAGLLPPGTLNIDDDNYKTIKSLTSDQVKELDSETLKQLYKEIATAEEAFLQAVKDLKKEGDIKKGLLEKINTHETYQGAPEIDYEDLGAELDYSDV